MVVFFFSLFVSFFFPGSSGYPGYSCRVYGLSFGLHRGWDSTVCDPVPPHGAGPMPYVALENCKMHSYKISMVISTLNVKVVSILEPYAALYMFWEHPTTRA